MLLSLHVKNLALIEEEEVNFTDGLNILTGETGAGKSIIIGSINMALGARADRSVIRTGAEYALIELTFSVDHERQLDKLRELDITPDEENIILIKRKILPTRSICSICGETVPLKQLREVGELLIDIYGQRENQRLLQKDAQRRTVDSYGEAATAPLLAQTAAAYKTWKKLSDEWEQDDMDESARLREMDLLTYEADEIEAAALREGEEEELAKEQRILGSFRKISEAAGNACRMTSEGGAADMIGRACRELSSASGVDDQLDALVDQLSEIDSLLSDFNRSLNEEVQEKTRNIKEIQRKVVLGMADLIDNRDSNTGGHVRRTSDIISIIVAEILRQGKLHLTEQQGRDIIRAAPTHDIGKIAIENSILNKPGRFTDEEYAIMKTHSAKSGEVVKILLEGVERASFVQVAYNVARYHHERWDGRGYPEGLVGSMIPLEARIMAVADVYDALVSKRVYKEPMSFEKSAAIMCEGMGTQFDPRLKAVFLGCRKELEAYYLAHDR